MDTNGCYSMFLMWTLCILVCAVYLFTGGFLLKRQVLTEKSACHNYSSPYPDSCNLVPRQYGKAIILIIDALKYDFAVYNDSVPTAAARPYQNRLPIIHSLAKGDGRLYEFLADPPTTTMQRLKGLTTGSLPTFIDVSSNFASSEISEDNIIDQLLQRGKRIVFAGDDTWMGLFPNRFQRAYPYPSFDVWDLDTVDNGVTKHLFNELNHPQHWDVFIGHFLGVDHVGHKYGPNHPEMTRKLSEMNTVIEHVTSHLPEDCVLFVMGDHGMTMTGDHGGDSNDEISAALFIYGKKDNKDNIHIDDKKNVNASTQLSTENATPSAINQVDFVPTFCLLLDLPIPFSNLGKVIYDVVVPAAVKQVQYLRVNVEQVFHYLETYNSYSHSSGGKPLPKSIFNNIEKMIQEFREKRSTALNGSDVKVMLDLGNQLLSKAKQMCQSTFIEFKQDLMSYGATLIFLLMILLLVTTWVPNKSILGKIIDLPCLVTVLLSAIFGAGLGSFTMLLTSKNADEINSKESTGTLFVITLAGFVSLIVFGLLLLWRIRHSIPLILNSLKADKISLLHYGLCGILFSSVFTNSYVVEEASVYSFCVLTSFISYFASSKYGDKKGVLILTIMIASGVISLTNVFFRCREEQQNYCTQTDYHKPLANLPIDTSRTYKNWRFFFTFISVILTFLLPKLFLTKGGNLNGMSIPVSLMSVVPVVSGVLLICNWALLAKNVFSSSIEAGNNDWQQHILARTVLIFCVINLLSLIISPKLIYKEKVANHQPREVFRSNDGGVRDYWNYMRTNWRQQFMVPSNQQQQILVYGIGTSLSAVFVSIATNFSLMTMLVLGDGLCPSMFLLMIGSALFLFITSVNRIWKLSVGSNTSDLLQVQWSDIIGWHLLEGLFFYGTGHQPTFPTIQWGAAFIGGFSGAEYGSSETNAVLGYILPAILIGWNTYISRIWFGLLLPMLLISPFAIWLVFQSLRPKGVNTCTTSKREFDNNSTISAGENFENDSSPSTLQSWGPNISVSKELGNGEVFFLENIHQTRSQVFNLCIRYCILQSLRVFATMLAAAIHRRHLMVWKIFAPRFIFEGIGCVVSFVFVTFGYLIFVRIQNSVSSYYQKLQLYDKDK